jgi:2-iminoacetate synthase
MIGNCCAPNALMTLREYIEDYASPTTQQLGLDMIAREINNINAEKIRQLTISHLNDIAHGKRDFRF